MNETEIPAISVESSIAASIPINSYPRQQLVLGPALNVTVRQGDKAVMPCITPHLGDRTVELIDCFLHNSFLSKEPKSELVGVISIWSLSVSSS